VVVLTCASGLASGQWLQYPTADVPRTPDGKPNLSAAAPRLPDGKPDFSGLWGTAMRNPCGPEIGRFIPCGAELPGSPLALGIGREMPGGLP
jgi:hypothetical protein